MKTRHQSLKSGATTLVILGLVLVIVGMIINLTGSDSTMVGVGSVLSQLGQAILLGGIIAGVASVAVRPHQESIETQAENPTKTGW